MEARAQQTADQICSLKEQVTALSLIHMSSLERNDDKFIVLYGAIMFLKQHMNVSVKRSRSKWQQFIIVLMKLRLDLLVQDLPYRFDASTSIVSRIWQAWINTIYMLAESTIIWSQREEFSELCQWSFANILQQRPK